MADPNRTRGLPAEEATTPLSTARFAGASAARERETTLAASERKTTLIDADNLITRDEDEIRDDDDAETTIDDDNDDNFDAVNPRPSQVQGDTSSALSASQAQRDSMRDSTTSDPQQDSLSRSQAEPNLPEQERSRREAETVYANTNAASARTSDQRTEDTTAETPLFSEFEIGDLRSRWSNVQAGFVDSPRRCVQQADELVATVMQRLANGFAEERSSLEKQWDRGDSVSTEDLRVALQRYRSFFGRLLNAA
jgi:hypothetical protein